MISASSTSQPPLIAFATWVAAVTAVFGALGVYGSRPGTHSHPPVDWPLNSHIERSAKGSTLLVFVHPGCPCTRATLENLKTVTTDLSLSIILISCEETSNFTSDLGSCRQQLREWERCDNVTIFRDIDGQETNRFQATTSGHCLLYDSSSMLTFSGGITFSRGHQGANAGMACLKAALNGHPTHDNYPVFGCPLLPEPLDQPAGHRDPDDKNLLPACCQGDCRV